MKARFIRAFYKTHKWCGLFVALHFVLLSLTGSLLLFREEITGESHEHGAVPALEAQKILDHTLMISPTSRPLSLTLKNEDVIEMRLGVNDSPLYRESHRFYFSPQGQSVEFSSQKPDWFDWVLRLHRELLLGSKGKIYIGLIGILYSFTLLSGFLIYGPFHKKLGFGEIRRHSSRTLSSDLHKYLGIVCLSWGLIIGISGAFLGLSSTLIKLFQYQELQYLVQKYPTVPQEPWASLDKIMEEAQKAIPHGVFEFLAFPNTQFSPPGHFLVLFHGNTSFTEKLVDLVVVDSVTGEVTDVRPLPWYLKFTLLSEPLHFGNYGGLALKVVWSILNLASLALPVLGILMWRRKRKTLPPQPNIHILPSLLLKKENWVVLSGFVGILGCFFLESHWALLAGAFIALPALLSLLALKIFKREKT